MMDDQKRALLPEEIITEILLRVYSARSLIRFRSVCKSWQSLLCNPSFIKMHISQSLSKGEKYVFLRNPGKSRYPSPILSIRCANTFEECFSFPLNISLPDKGSIRMVGSCNGLLCCSLSNCGEKDRVYLCNPATKELKGLVCYHKTGYDKSFGFGFDPLVDDYKTVRVVYVKDYNNNIKIEVGIFRWGIQSWKVIGDIDFPFQIGERSRQALVNGSIYWQSKYSNEKHPSIMVIGFDLSNEVFQQIMLPEAVLQHCKYEKDINIGVLWGCLSVMTQFDDIEIWVMKEHGVSESWIKQIVVEEPMLYAIGFRSDGKLLMQKIWYDLVSQTTKHVDRKFSDYSGYSVFSYVESLVSVNHQCKQLIGGGRGPAEKAKRLEVVEDQRKKQKIGETKMTKNRKCSHKAIHL